MSSVEEVTWRRGDDDGFASLVEWEGGQSKLFPYMLISDSLVLFTEMLLTSV